MRAAILALAALLAASAANAAEIHVLGSPGLREPYTELAPAFERASGHRVTTEWGGVVDVARRVAEGETADVILLPAAQIDDLVRQGKLLASTRADIATSGIGVAIRKGAPRIDLTSGEALKNALLTMGPIAYSRGPSGMHMAETIRNWGIEDRLEPKIVIAPSDTPVGVMVARGDAEIGFQQISELIRVPGIDYLGPLPPDIQEITLFAAAVHRDAAEPDAAEALIRFLSAPEAASVIRKAGMEPR